MLMAEECEVGAPGEYCDVQVGISPYYVGGAWDQLQSGPGTGVSAPITITFDVPIERFSVEVWDPDWYNNHVLALDSAGATVDSFTVWGDLYPGNLTIESATVEGPGIREVILVPAPADYVAYSDLTFWVPGDIELTCSPSTVERGQAIACTASKPSGADSFRVNSWKFESAQLSDSIVSTSTDTVWGGTVAAGGTVTVRGKVNLTPRTGTATFSVSARDWSEMTVDHTVVDSTPTELPEYPERVGHLGGHSPEAETDLAPAVFSQVGSGPNEGVLYYVQVPVLAKSTVRVNRVALAVNSAFYLLQPTSPPGCTQAQVVPFMAIVEVHEGLTLADTSHAGTYRRWLNDLLPQPSEGIVALNSVTLLDSLANASLGPHLDTASVRADDDSGPGGTVPPVTYCIFKYF